MNKKEKIIRKYRHIAISGAGPGVGTSFIALGLTCYFAQKGMEVSYTECGLPGSKRSLIWDKASRWKEFKGREFIDFYHMAKGINPIAGRHNYLMIDQGSVDLRIISPENKKSEETLEREEMLRLLASARGDVCIFDVEGSDDYLFAAMDVDVLMVVLDPTPSVIQGQRERIAKLENVSRTLRNQGSQVIWVVNGDNLGVNRRHLKAMIKERNLVYFPQIPRELIDGSEYGGENPWMQREIQEIFYNFFEGI